MAKVIFVNLIKIAMWPYFYTGSHSLITQQKIVSAHVKLDKQVADLLLIQTKNRLSFSIKLFRAWQVFDILTWNKANGKNNIFS